MIPLVNYRHQYVFYFNPKSACSIYRKLFMALHANEKDYGRNRTHHFATQYWRPDPARPHQDFFAFTIVRNPFNRLVSAYLDKCFQWKYRDSDRYANCEASATIHPPIFRFLGREPDYTRGVTFREFVRYLEQPKPIKEVDIHFRPQARPDIHVDAFHRLEDPVENLVAFYKPLFSDKPKMMQRFDNMFEMHVAKTARLKNPSFREEDTGVYDGPCADLTFADLEELKQQGLKPLYHRFYDDELTGRVTRTFALEFERYGYPAQPPQATAT